MRSAVIILFVTFATTTITLIGADGFSNTGYPAESVVLPSHDFGYRTDQPREYTDDSNNEYYDEAAVPITTHNYEAGEQVADNPSFNIPFGLLQIPLELIASESDKDC